MGRGVGRPASCCHGLRSTSGWQVHAGKPQPCSSTYSYIVVEREAHRGTAAGRRALRGRWACLHVLQAPKGPRARPIGSLGAAATDQEREKLNLPFPVQLSCLLHTPPPPCRGASLCQRTTELEGSRLRNSGGPVSPRETQDRRALREGHDCSPGRRAAGKDSISAVV